MQSFVGTIKRNGPGLAGSILLHAAALLAILSLFMRHTLPQSPAPFLAVEVIRLGPSSQAPHGANGPTQISRPTLPKQTAASPSNEAVGPRGIKPVQDALEAKLKALARQERPTPKLAIDNDIGENDETAGGGDGGLSYTVRDFIRAQILRRWNLNLSNLWGRRIVVRLSLTMRRNGAITAVDIAPMTENDPVIRDVAISARNAALLASPIQLPPGDYPNQMHFSVALDAREARR